MGESLAGWHTYWLMGGVSPSGALIDRVRRLLESNPQRVRLGIARGKSPACAAKVNARLKDHKRTK
jgi:hypothetical protein